MTRSGKVWLGVTVVLAVAGISTALIWFSRPKPPQVEPVTITGVVLRQDNDPRKQTPVADAEITASGGDSTAVGKSNAEGSFRLVLQPGLTPEQTVALHIRHKDYRPMDILDSSRNQLFVARLEPLVAQTPVLPNIPKVVLKDVRVRYTVKSVTTINVGSAAKFFELSSTGNVPCNGQQPCSPDNKWKAKLNSISLDAGENSEFQNARLSCIAGPCPFSKVESDNFSHPGRSLRANILTWSDTVTYLAEAEVIRTMVSDMVRQSYPINFGSAMNFTLPATAEGPAIQADLNGTNIVFPLGPQLRLSWAACGLETAPDHTKLYQCQLKPGYVIQQQ
jgi:hypothetical protein